jgi:bacillithiol biosynthesis deacetylase BshB1
MGIDLLAVGAHPDDVDMIAGGTIAKLVSRGKSVVILDLTRGEMGSRGSPDLRAKEAQCAAGVLGVNERITLDLGDGRLEDNMENRRKVMEIIRQFKPTVVAGHYWDDLHPDHAASGKILRSIMYSCGFLNYPAAGEPYRPNEFLFFMAHTPFEPSFIVDITGFQEKKMQAVRCFSSQFYSQESREAPTLLAQPDFLDRLEGRARYYGSLIDRPFGEPFLTVRSVPMVDPVDHYAPFPKFYGGKEKDADKNV